MARRIGATRTTLTGDGVQIALIDTGIVDVPGLRNSNILLGPDFSFEDIDPDLRAHDTNGHGTHLAGIIVGTDEAFSRGDTVRRPDRPLGIAPAAGLVSIKVGSADGAVDVTQVIAAINWVIASNERGDTDIRVLNLAFGTNGVQSYQADPLAYAVERAWHAGIVVVVAAGNDGLAAGQLKNPAIDPYVIAVGAATYLSDTEMSPANFSSGGGSRGVDLLAPGRRIVSLRNPGSYVDLQLGGAAGSADLMVGSGTSQAAAVVSGAVALLLQDHPALTPDQVKKILMDSAAPVKDEDGNAVGAGFLRIDEALKRSAPAYAQTYPRSTGTGSIDLARGSVRVAINGQPLQGEVDIFGNSWTGNSWTTDSWAGNSWTGNSWTGNSWTGNSWTGNSWTGHKWNGNSWTGNSWTGNSWTGNSWTGNCWTGNSWTGNSWTGNSWTGNSWTGNSWTGNSWTGNSWS